jgi:predicted transcriptional regulator
MFAGGIGHGVLIAVQPHSSGVCCRLARRHDCPVRFEPMLRWQILLEFTSV